MSSFENPSYCVWFNLCVSTNRSGCSAARAGVTRYQDTRTRVTHTCQNYVNKYSQFARKEIYLAF